MKDRKVKGEKVLKTKRPIVISSRKYFSKESLFIILRSSQKDGCLYKYVRMWKEK